VLENEAGRPRFQIYRQHISAPSFDTALEQIRALRAPELVIENPPGADHLPEPDDWAALPAPDDLPPPMVEVVQADATSYRFNVRAAQPSWLFVADSYYPGWCATLDKEPVPLFPAQLLGKAVAVPPGLHEVTLAFHSAPFSRGALITLVAAALAGAAFWNPRLAAAWRKKPGFVR
jgi:hypothetical protein